MLCKFSGLRLTAAALLTALAVCFLFSGCAVSESAGDSEFGGSAGNITESGAGDEIISGSDGSDEEKSDGSDIGVISEIFVTVNSNKLKIALAANSSVDALVEILKQGDVTYTANDYGDFEKVGNIGFTLPRNDTRIATQAGDVILYQGNNICLYYGSNDWNFTRIGKINGYTESELRALLGAGSGSVTVTLSLK